MSAATTKSHRKSGRSRGRRVDNISLREIADLFKGNPKRPDLLIEYLHQIQDKYGYLSTQRLHALGHAMGLSSAEVYEVASFYHHFDVVKENDTPPPRLTVRVCDSISCEMFGAHGLIDELAMRLGEEANLVRVPCVGRCETAPVAVVGAYPVKHATTQKVLNAVKNGQIQHEPEGYIDFHHYRSTGGYHTLNRYLTGQLSDEEILTAVDGSNLRGLGGAGFPVGQKWRIVQGQPSPRLMAVNIDEGEPGTFKDRHYLEREPHRFLEGMLIAAQVVGIESIYIYLRDEYAACRKLLSQELAVLKKEFGHPLPAIHLRRGAGAYVCGEESAMIESIEGKRGMPRLRPPYVAQVGLFDRPTLVHNMESLYWIPRILENGSQWFTSQGRHGRRGLRSFSVSGRVRKPGVHLAPAGITVRELIEEHCDGMQADQKFYGYLPGGASGGILPASLGDLPLDFGTLDEYGCFIGSAAVIVLSNRDLARTAAANAMRFFAAESCGQCTPCRVGTTKAVRLMEHKHWDGELMHDLTRVMRDASICGLGQAAPNPMHCVLKYFHQEI